MVSQAGTRNAQLIYRSASLNNTRASVSTYRGDLGDYVVARTDISFTAPDTIGCAGGAFPEFFSNAQVNGTFTNLVTNSDFASVPDGQRDRDGQSELALQQPARQVAHYHQPLQ